MKSKRLLALPPYLFEELERRCSQAVAAGRDVINLSVGDPDLEPPGSLKRFLVEAVERSEHHRYPPQRGLVLLKDSIRDYMKAACGLEPDDDEILVLVGSKEGIAHLPLAVCDPGDAVLVPDPGYPVYESAAVFAGCRPKRIVLTAENGYLPDIDEMERMDLEGARLCFINYPNNPTGATAREDWLGSFVEYAAGMDMVVANDAAYADIYDGERPALLASLPGILEKPVIEFFSFSKMFSITGWRVGFAVGNRKIIEALAHLKANVDSGVFGALQEALARTLSSDGSGYTERIRSIYRSRRSKAAELLDRMGLDWFRSDATFYLWVSVPGGGDSLGFALELLEGADVLVTPGAGFGEAGQGCFRVALTCDERRLEEAGRRLADFVQGQA